MHRLFAALPCLLPLAAGPALAQSVELPRPSPAGKISQTVGLTDIAVEYSSPAVCGRPIWGSLVPYGQVWRAGANMATRVTFGKDVTIGDTAVPAGAYSFFLVPESQGPWTAVFNKEAVQPGAFNYKKELDLVRVAVQPEAIPLRERLAYLVTDFTNDAAQLSLEWEKVRVSVPIKLGTEAQLAATFKSLEDNAWAPTNAVARYYLDQTRDFDTGLSWVEKSLRIKEDWANLWTKAQLLAAKGNRKEALALAQKAQQLGEKAPRFFAAADVKKALVDWKR
jgi:Protein of unknown function (DUF2911)